MTATATPIRPKVDVGLDEQAEQNAQMYRAPTEHDPFADRKRWTQKECTVLEAAGVLVPGKYELLHGEIVEKMGQWRPHMVAGKRVFLALSLIFGADCIVLPMTVSVDEENGPEPDVAVAQFPDSHYVGRDDQPTADLHLVVEIANTTLWRDRNTKMLLYAQAGVPEYWVLDIKGRKLWRHLNPSATGYADIQEMDEAATVVPLAAPTGTNPVRVLDLLP